jgi:protein-S-isoprenylcysteine O-methyltransferase Ste14
MINFREASFSFTLFLILIDVLIPPVELPAEPHDEDALVSLFFVVVFLWRLPLGLRVGLAGAASIAGLQLWRKCVGGRWASGKPCPEVSAGFFWQLFGGLLVVGGWGLRAWSKIVLGESFKYQIAAPDELIVAGPYAVWIHPSYAGFMAQLFGALMLLFVTLRRRVPILLTVFTVALAVLYLRILDEEAMLQQHFADAWAAHRASRWRLVPYVW